MNSDTLNKSPAKSQSFKVFKARLLDHVEIASFFTLSDDALSCRGCHHHFRAPFHRESPPFAIGVILNH